MERDKYAKVVHEELTKLGIEFSRYKERLEKKGLVVSPAYGHLSLTLPRFNEVAKSYM